MPFFRGYDPSELDENGKPLPVGPGPAIVVICFVALIVGLILAGKALAEVTPEKQAQLEQHGWVVVDESSTEPLVTEAGVNDCRHGATKKAASAIRDWKDDVLVRARIKLSVCVANGRIVWRHSSYRHTAPGRQWDRVTIPYLDPWMCCHRRSAGLRAKQEWVFHGVIDNYWELSLKLTAHVRGDHGVYFTVKRRWS